MKTLTYLFVLVLGFALVSCGAKQEGTEAEVSEAQEVQEVVASTEYTVDTDNSVVTWIGSKPAGKHNGTIPVSSGTIAVEGDAIVGGTITIDVASIENEDLAEDQDMYDKLVGHLKSADFFHTDSFPTAEFVITSVAPYTAADKPEGKDQYETENKPVTADEYMVASPTHKITGNLTMRGTTKSITFPAAVDMTDGTIKATAKFNIDRTQWGVMYGNEASVVDKAKDSFIYDTVNVGFEFTANNAAM